MFTECDELLFKCIGESLVCTVALASASSFPSTLLKVLFSSCSSLVCFLTVILSSVGFDMQGMNDLLFPYFPYNYKSNH